MALALSRDFDPRYGEAVTVAPGVRRITAANPGPFTYRGTNTFLIGEGTIAVLDPGPNDPLHRQAILRTAAGAEVEYILITHAHRDHVSGARQIADVAGAPILAAEPRRGRRQPEPSGEGDEANDPAFAPDGALDDGAILDIGAYRLEVVATPGHASDHLAFALLGRDCLFSGDHVMGWSTTLVAPPDGSMASYMRSLDRLLARTERLYLPAHGGEIINARSHVLALREHRRDRERAIVECLRRGDTTIPQVVERVYTGLDRRLLGAAERSTLAHLEDLVARGLVATDQPPDLSATYRPAEATPEAEPPSDG